MTLKMKVGRFLILMFFTCMVLTSIMAQAKAPELSTQQIEVLNLLKKDTIELIERQKRDAEELRRCFAFPVLCQEDIYSLLPTIRQTIHEKSAEYRLLVGLSRSVKALQGGHTVRIGMTIPAVTLETTSPSHRPSELEIVRNIYRSDIAAINKLYKSNGNTLFTEDSALYPQLTQLGQGSWQYAKATEEFYETQALLLANQLPFIIYIDEDEIDDRIITHALSKYVERIQDILNETFDPELTPLESFLMYEPLVQNLMQKAPSTVTIIEQLLKRQNIPQKGVNAWIARNSMSLKFAALTTCSLVSAIIQSWPLSLACTGTAAAFSGKQFYDEFSRLDNNFSMWLMGAQSYQALRDNESRLIYSTFTLLLIGQSIGSTIKNIESGLISSLTALPSTAAARFTSLQALRDGSLRFASRTANFKGRDLGASILSVELFDANQLKTNLTREQRIFTYADFIKLSEVPVAATP